MKKFTKKMIRYVLVSALCFSLVTPAFAATKAEVQDEISRLQSQQSELEAELAALKQNKSDTEAYISELDAKINVYVGKLEKVSKELRETKAEIKITKEDLAEAEADEETQYIALKSRIKAMYESGSTDYVTMLLNTGDLKELLNESEYISKINTYDRNLLTSLVEIREKIEAYKKKLVKQQKKEEQKQEEYQIQMDSLTAIVADKEEELVALGQDIDSVASTISDTEDQIAEENALLAEIEEAERKAAEEAARKKAEEEAARKRAEEEEARRQAEEEARRQEEEEAYDDYDDDDDDSYYDDDDYDDGGSDYSSSGFIWPVGSTYITSYFGYRSSPTAGASSYHQGIDIGAGYGSSIWASASGTVTTASYSSAMGNYIVISHGNGVSTVYEHCSALYVSAGQYVSQGQTIAAVGSTGISTGAHLHFGVSVGGSYVNPLAYVSP